jgi:hypothetical protein
MKKKWKKKRKREEKEGNMRDPRMWEGRPPGEPRSAAELFFHKEKKVHVHVLLYVGSRGNLESLAQGERTRNWFAGRQVTSRWLW